MAAQTKKKGRKHTMKTLAIWFGKKYALSLVQDAVSAKKDKVAKWSQRIAVWIERIGLVAKFLGALADRLSDGVLTEVEAEMSVKEAKQLAEQVTVDVEFKEV